MPPKPSSWRAARVSGEGGTQGLSARSLLRQALHDFVPQQVRLLAQRGVNGGTQPRSPC